MNTNNMDALKIEKYRPTANIIKRYYNGRTVVSLGDSELLRTLLEQEYNISINMFATRIKEQVKDNVILFNELKNKSSEYYIVIPLIKEDNKLKQKLIAFGYEEFKDFVFTLHNRIIYKIQKGEYLDEYGNHIISETDNVTNVIIIQGVGNTFIKIDKNVVYRKSNLAITVTGSGAEICIGEGCLFNSNNTILVGMCSKLHIGKNTRINARTSLTASSGCSVNIGDDCIISYDVEIHSGDGHTVFDVKTGQRTLPLFPPSSKNSIEIKDHAWIGLRAIILNNTVIGQSSIVGAGAVVKGKFPNNCAIAGNPAKMVKKDLTWHNYQLEEDINNCGDENVRFTEDI